MAKDEVDKDEEAPKKVPARGVPIKLVLIIGVATLLVGLGVTLAVLKFSSQDKHDTAQAAPTPAKEAKADAASTKVADGQMFDLEPFIVNLADSPEIRYLKLTMKLELESDAQSADVTARTPQVRDAILVLLSSKDSTTLRTTQGKFQLREELTQRVNASLPKKIIRTVYFTEFVLQ